MVTGWTTPNMVGIVTRTPGLVVRMETGEVARVMRRTRMEALDMIAKDMSTHNKATDGGISWIIAHGTSTSDALRVFVMMTSRHGSARIAVRRTGTGGALVSNVEHIE